VREICKEGKKRLVPEEGDFCLPYEFLKVQREAKGQTALSDLIPRWQMVGKPQLGVREQCGRNFHPITILLSLVSETHEYQMENGGGLGFR